MAVAAVCDECAYEAVSEEFCGVEWGKSDWRYCWPECHYMRERSERDCAHCFVLVLFGRWWVFLVVVFL
jgi:hypothetical protein